MEYLEISNKNEICKSAFVLMGASTKRDDNSKIGYFGTGIKYAIATIVRSELPLTIYSGEQEIVVKVKAEKMRDRVFKTLTIAGRRTSITTEMGIDWEVWQSIREIYCNALDEEDPTIKIVSDIQPEAGRTKFFIGIKDDIQDVLDDWDKYFSNKRTDIMVENKDWQVFSGKDTLSLYRKQIKCYNTDRSSLYDYNLNDVEISESRLVKYEWTIKEKIAKLWGLYANATMIRNLFDNCSMFAYENSLYWSWAKTYHEGWLDVINGRTLIHRNVAGYFMREQADGKCLVLETSLINSLKRYFGEKVKVAGQSDPEGQYIVVDRTQKMDYLIDETLKFFKDVGLEIEFPIKVAMFVDKKVLGQADEQEIILSVDLFELGRKQVASTVLEEAFHIQSGLHDETRGFQNYLINKVITLLENKNGYFL